ncbi:hypothetical protein LTR08_002532 [Meristemomyces frigidus]|nr:hypothetical protein LTR08_002532 [Meristemomyces frigidus]
MAAAVSLDDSITTDPRDDDDDDGDEDAVVVGERRAVFAAQWQTQDTAQLAPTALAIARVRRAWERRAWSPVARRGGKVWKRGALPLPAGLARDEQGVGMQSPMKPVKKLCLDEGFGVGARVSRWEGRGSPGGRRIVTRSAGGGEWVALAGDVGEGGALGVEGGRSMVGTGVFVEVVDEEGNVLVGGDEGGEEEAAQWEDVEDQEEEEGMFDEDTMVHLDAAIQHPPNPPPRAQHEPIFPTPNSPAEPIHTPSTSTATSPPPTLNPLTPAEKTTADSPPKHPPLSATPTNPPPPTQQHPLPLPLPSAPVSPAQPRRKLGPRASKVVAAARRKTLPVPFAPESSGAGGVGGESGGDQGVEGVERGGIFARGEGGGALALVVGCGDGDGDGDGDVRSREWKGEHVAAAEDVESAVDTRPTTPHARGPQRDAIAIDAARLAHAPESPPPRAAALGHEPSRLSIEPPLMPEASPAIPTPNTDKSASKQRDSRICARPNASPHSAASSSPVPARPGPGNAIADPTPVSPPLRRSSRRSSSTPLKPRALTERKSHLIAFTPIRGRRGSEAGAGVVDGEGACLTTTTATTTTPAPALDVPPPPPPPSAPPLEPHPRKSNLKRTSSHHLRLSDDTALLRAFLHRAAANRVERHVPTAVQRRESGENLREAETVRAALASCDEVGMGEGGEGEWEGVEVEVEERGREGGVQVEVLGERDVNSFSPRKHSSAFLSDGAAAGSSGAIPASSDTTLTTTADDSNKPATAGIRRSKRSTGRKKPTPPIPSYPTSSASGGGAPNRITIRAPGAGFVERVGRAGRSVAQELAVATRGNTRRNKGGSVLPKVIVGLMRKGGGVGVGVEGEGEGAAAEAVVSGVVARGDEVGVGTGRRGVRWAETLTSFYAGATVTVDLDGEDAGAADQGPDDFKRGGLSSLGQVLPANHHDDDDDDDDAGAVGEGLVVVGVERVGKTAPAPADTPSKPKGKVRRLKSARTAASAAAAASTTRIDVAASAPSVEQILYEPTPAEEEGAGAHKATPPAPTTTPAPAPAPALVGARSRRSRIATPAKGLGTNSGSASLLPPLTGTGANFAPRPTIATVVIPSPEKKKAAVPPEKKEKAAPTPRRKIAASGSKLPTAGALGKEPPPTTQPPTLSSPAKKRKAAPASALPTAKTFAPRLDFGGALKAVELPKAASVAHAAAAAVETGLAASPAKKRRVGVRKAGTGVGGLGASVGGEDGGRGEEGGVLGLLGSPAKKRVRRGGV